MLVKQGLSKVDAQVQVERIKADYKTSGVGPREMAILDYAVKLTVSPAEMEKTDVETLKKHGLDDRAVHDLCAATAYFAFVNRIADGLGVELEDDSV